MPFQNSGPAGSSVLSPLTPKSHMPANNVPTVMDFMNGKKTMKDILPGGGGDWSPGEDTSKSYREKGNDYKRRARDLDLLSNMVKPHEKNTEVWRVKFPGGSREFTSFEMATQYKEKQKAKGVPSAYLSRVAQVEENNVARMGVIADSINQCFLVESIDLERGVMETGSAFCVGKGLYLTCAHVIKKYDKNTPTSQFHFFKNVTVSMSISGEKFGVDVVAVDSQLDIALLKSEAISDAFDLGDEIKVGEEIICISSPYGYENHVSEGIVGSLDRQIYFYEGAPTYTFIDLSIYPGSSGAPVISLESGKVVGLVTLIVSSAAGYGLNASLPPRYIKDFLSKNS